MIIIINQFYRVKLIDVHATKPNIPSVTWAVYQEDLLHGKTRYDKSYNL